MSDNRAANHELYKRLAKLDPWFGASYVPPVIEDARVPVGVIAQRRETGVPEMMQRVPVPLRETEQKTPWTGWVEGDRCSVAMCNKLSFDEPTKLCYYHRNLQLGRNRAALALADCIDA